MRRNLFVLLFVILLSFATQACAGGSKVALLDMNNELVDTVKAASLAGKPDLLFRRNSLNGRIEVKPNRTAVELNADLHTNN